MTARWAVDVVQPERDLEITWEPISLLFKNEPEPDNPFYAANVFTHGLLRVMQAVNEGEGNQAAGSLYRQYGAVLHHDRVAGTVDLEELAAGDATPFLEAAGLPIDYNAAFADESWDTNIEERMQAGLDLVGTDVGTHHRLRHGEGPPRHLRADHQSDARGRRRRRALGCHGQDVDHGWLLGAEANPDRRSGVPGTTLTPPATPG